eukprot:1188336-Rhodomonas_salina.1
MTAKLPKEHPLVMVDSTHADRALEERNAGARHNLQSQHGLPIPRSHMHRHARHAHGGPNQLDACDRPGEGRYVQDGG